MTPPLLRPLAFYRSSTQFRPDFDGQRISDIDLEMIADDREREEYKQALEQLKAALKKQPTKWSDGNG